MKPAEREWALQAAATAAADVRRLSDALTDDMRAVAGDLRAVLPGAKEGGDALDGIASALASGHGLAAALERFVEHAAYVTALVGVARVLARRARHGETASRDEVANAVRLAQRGPAPPQSPPGGAVSERVHRPSLCADCLAQLGPPCAHPGCPRRVEREPERAPEPIPGQVSIDDLLGEGKRD